MTPYTPYTNINLILHRFRWWLVTWQHEVITRTNIDFSSKVFCDIHIKAVSQEVLMNWISNMYSKITLLKLLQHLLGTNGLSFVNEIGGSSYELPVWLVVWVGSDFQQCNQCCVNSLPLGYVILNMQFIKDILVNVLRTSCEIALKEMSQTSLMIGWCWLNWHMFICHTQGTNFWFWGL